MTDDIKHKCDRCGRFRPAPNARQSYFTDREWYCDDCRYKQAVENGMLDIASITKAAKKLKENK